MKRKRSIPFTLLANTRGQSWVETVVMLLLIVPLLLGLFFLHDLATTRIRAIQAARFVVWETNWYGREDEPNRAMRIQTQTQWIARLKQIGLGAGLSNVDVFKRNVRQYMLDVGDGANPEFYLPCPLSKAFEDLVPGGGSCGTENGSDQSQGFISGIADSFSGVLDGLSSLAGTAAIPFQDLMAQNTKWDDEKNNSVFTARVIYKMRYTGFFQNFGTTTVVQRGSIISHPYVLRRTDDNKEYEELLGNPCPPPDGSGGHVVGLWLVPRAIIPISGGGTSAGDAANSALGFLGGLGKCAVSGIGQIAGGLDKFLGSNLGFTMPDGTLKEYPELNMPAKSGVGSTDPSGSSLGRRCGEGGGGAMGSGGCS